MKKNILIAALTLVLGLTTSLLYTNRDNIDFPLLSADAARHGGYDPHDVNANFHGGSYIDGVKTTYLNPHRNISKVIPHCKIPEELSVLRRFYKMIGIFSGQYTECE